MMKINEIVSWGGWFVNLARNSRASGGSIDRGGRGRVDPAVRSTDKCKVVIVGDRQKLQRGGVASWSKSAQFW